PTLRWRKITGVPMDETIMAEMAAITGNKTTPISAAITTSDARRTASLGRIFISLWDRPPGPSSQGSETFFQSLLNNRAPGPPRRPAHRIRRAAAAFYLECGDTLDKPPRLSGGHRTFPQPVHRPAGPWRDIARGRPALSAQLPRALPDSCWEPVYR